MKKLSASPNMAPKIAHVSVIHKGRTLEPINNPIAVMVIVPGTMDPMMAIDSAKVAKSNDPSRARIALQPFNHGVILYV